MKPFAPLDRVDIRVLGDPQQAIWHYDRGLKADHDITYQAALRARRGPRRETRRMAHIYRAVVPYVLFSLAVLVVIFLFPAVATWLPSKIG